MRAAGHRSALPLQLTRRRVLGIRYPTCLYPKAQEHIVEVLKDLPERVRRKVLHDTAARVYNLPV